MSTPALSVEARDQLGRARDLVAVLHAAVNAPPSIRWHRAGEGISAMLGELDEILSAIAAEAEDRAPFLFAPPPDGEPSIEDRTMSDSTPVFLRRHQVEARIGLKRSAIYKQMSQGTFPRPARLNGKAVAWLESEIIAWQQAQIEASRLRAAP